LRYFLDISYKGTRYAGWQIQENAYTVQQELNEALAKVFRSPIKTIGSGRTDTGVHAEQQIVHLDLPYEMTDDHMYRLNCILSYDIAINGFYEVATDAHARFDAVSRAYEYRIIRSKNPFLKDYSYLYPKPLDIGLMNEAGKLLMQHKDFESFSKVKTTVDHFLCDITRAEWKEENNMLVFHIEANRFLRGMVRAITGTMLDLGSGKTDIGKFEAIISAKNRQMAGSAAPPEGLFLTKIVYPKTIYKI
jgi:tRNA pseudouridine38-40 synthase